MKYLTSLLTILILFNCSWSQDPDKNTHFFFYPKSYDTWQYSSVLGLSVTKLPIHIVEDEINTVPMLNSEFRLGLSKRIDVNLQFYTNYLANLGSVGFQWMLLDKWIVMGVGVNTSIWFGHLELEAIRLKSMGVVVSPLIVIGYDARDFIIATSFEVQSSYMKTSSDDILLGEFYRPFSSYNFKIYIEQPLWNNHWVVLGLKLNYAKFYYQSWLAYSTIDEYFFYPEFLFGFIL